MLRAAKQNRLNRRLKPALACSAIVWAATRSGMVFGQGIQYKADPDAASKKTVRRKGFDPKPMLHSQAHQLPLAKFPVTDIQNHVVFAQIDWSKISALNFSTEMVAQLDDAVRRGARGLKVLQDVGLGIRGESGKFVAGDNPRLDPVWEECRRMGIPVAIHTSEPEEPMYANHSRWLKTADEYFPYWGYPAQGRSNIYGMQLPDSTLEKVYHGNAEKFFAQFKGLH